MKRKRASGQRKPKIPLAKKGFQNDTALVAQYDVLNDEAEQPEINTSCQPLGKSVSDLRIGRNIHSLHKGAETPRTGTITRDRQEDLDIAEAVNGRMENCPNSLRQMIVPIIEELSMDTGGLANQSRSLGDNPISNEQTVQHRVDMDLEENASGLRQNPEYKKLELDAALTVIKKTMKLDAADPFNRPVDPIALEIPDYFDVIKTPMDFGTICNNLENGLKYVSSEDVYKDVQYIWYNCLKYNKKGDHILELMKSVKTCFMKYWVAAGLHAEKSPAIVDMPKTKRFINPRKSKNPVPPKVDATLHPMTSQFVPHVQPTSEPMHSVHPTLQSVPTVPVPHVQPTSEPMAPFHPTSRLMPPVHPTSQSMSVHSTSQSVPPSPATNEAESRRRVGRQSDRSWAVNTIDSQGTARKLNIKVKDASQIPQGQRIVVEFNNGGGAIGEAQPLLAGYLGSLATNCELFPINFDKFPDMPDSYFDDAFESLIKARFYLNTSETVARRYVHLSIVDKWGQHRQNLWNEFNDPASTRDEIIQNVPTGIQRDQWATFVAYRLSPKCKALCERNSKNRKKQTITHTCGSKPFARKCEEMIAETGQIPGRGQLYLATHRKKDGSYTDGAKEVCKKIEETLSQSSIDESVISPDDAVGKVLGPEHSGRVRCLGLGSAPTHVFNKSRVCLTGDHYGGCSSECKDKYNQVMDSLMSVKETNTLLVNTLKSYMMSMEGGIPQQFVEIFASTSHTPDDASSGHISRDDDGCANDGHDIRFR